MRVSTMVSPPAVTVSQELSDACSKHCTYMEHNGFVHVEEEGKTGYTEDAGYCLAASAKRDGMRLISVVMGSDSESTRASETQLSGLNQRTTEKAQCSMLDWKFRCWNPLTSTRR